MPRIIIETDSTDLAKLAHTSDDNMRFVELTLDQARTLSGTTEEWTNNHDLDDALDEMQGLVHSGTAPSTYVIIRIR